MEPLQERIELRQRLSLSRVVEREERGKKRRCRCHQQKEALERERFVKREMSIIISSANIIDFYEDMFK